MAGTGRVHVHVVRLDGGADAGALSPREARRAAALRNPLERARFVACRAAVREILGGRLGIAPRDVAIVTGAHGKPCVRGGPAFSVAHSGELALVAISAAGELGVDVERIRPGVDDDLVSQRFFDPVERRALAATPEDARADLFFRLWTAKEAIVKAAGTGLVEPLPVVGAAALTGRGRRCAGWWVRELDVAPGYAAAIASASPVTDLRIARLSPEPV